MNVVINKSVARGKINAPPSKSMAHRALICGALSECSIIENIAYSKDIDATLGCLQAMGAFVEKHGSYVKIGGLNPRNIPENAQLFCNESGSTLRFLIPLCMQSESKKTLTGSERLFQRPLDIYEEIAKKNGLTFEKTNDGIIVGGVLSAGDFSVRGDVSSQFITGLLYVLPLLENDSRLVITGRFESASYIDLTLACMKDFGIQIERCCNEFFIKGNQKYEARNYTVEGDCSNAAFLEAFNLIGGNVEVCGISKNTLQGDRVYIDMFNGLRNGQKYFDLSDCPDLAPVMFAMAAFYGGAEFVGTARLKIKESDRAEAMACELSKMGINCQIFENRVIIENGVLHKPTEIIDGHNDHRIVMAMALLLTLFGGEITDAQAVSKSYPDFFEVIKNLGIDVI